MPKGEQRDIVLSRIDKEEWDRMRADAQKCVKDIGKRLGTDETDIETVLYILGVHPIQIEEDEQEYA